MEWATEVLTLLKEFFLKFYHTTCDIASGLKVYYFQKVTTVTECSWLNVLGVILLRNAYSFSFWCFIFKSKLGTAVPAEAAARPQMARCARKESCLL